MQFVGNTEIVSESLLKRVKHIGTLLHSLICFIYSFIGCLLMSPSKERNAKTRSWSDFWDHYVLFHLGFLTTMAYELHWSWIEGAKHVVSPEFTRMFDISRPQEICGRDRQGRTGRAWWHAEVSSMSKHRRARLSLLPTTTSAESSELREP